MKKIIAAAAAAVALTATTAMADDYERYGDLDTNLIGCIDNTLACWKENEEISSNRPKPTDKVYLGNNLKCDVLAIKGWSPVISDNKIYEEITRGSLWVKGDRYAHCVYDRDVFLFDKADIDNFVKYVSEHRDNNRKKSNENFTKGLDKL